MRPRVLKISVKKFIKRCRKLARRQWRYVVAGAFVAACVILPVVQADRYVDTTALLNIIAKGESRGNYNAYYGNASNQEVKFTEMPVADVLAWQEAFVQQGSPSSAVGRYQFIRPTLAGLVKELSIDESTVLDEQLQDRLAKRLLERRGLSDYVKGKITREEFAHNLSKEWAALPKVIGNNPDQSYYQGDGLNYVQISIDEIFSGIAALRP